MALKMFNFIDEVINELDNERDYLDGVCNIVEEYFEEILLGNCEGYINISSRVKGSKSLREKILRNNYYTKYDTSKELLYNLSDLIGIRIECRFIKDEDDIYKILKGYFSIKKENEYNNENNKNIILDLSGIQPQEQKNGFKIYRIDGAYIDKGVRVPFELQIKSMVNMFWGEIEHKIIYKNTSYMLIDSYLKDIMSSIKKSLMMIDHQLLVTYNQFNVQNTTLNSEQKTHFEKLLSKIIYDAYALKMKNTIGFVVDFKKPCDTIMKYVLRGDNGEYSEKLIKILERFNDISNLDTKFDEEIVFEREIIFNDEFTKEIGEKLLEEINNDFKWNLFFRIIFEIETGNNAEDFEAFIAFIRDIFLNQKEFEDLKERFSYEEVNVIRNDFMAVVSKAFVNINSIEFILEGNLFSLDKTIGNEISTIKKELKDFEAWERNKIVYLELLYIKILAIFDLDIDTIEVLELINKIPEVSSNLTVNALIFKYGSSLQSQEKMKAKDVIKYIIF